MTPDPYSLDKLHDIVQPVAVSWWPPAAGLWILLALLLVWCVAIGVRFTIRYSRNTYRREALVLLRDIEPRLQPAETRNSALGELATLLKRVALNAYSRNKVAQLSGKRWLAFLDHSGNTDQFSRGAAAVIAEVTWQPQAGSNLSDQELKQISDAAHHWISQHSREAPG